MSKRKDVSIDTPELLAHVDAIRSLGKQTIANVISIGGHLKECKRIVGHGGFGAWLKREFEWHEQTARNFIHVYEMSKSKKFLDLNSVDLPVSALYLLAAPSTPPEVSKEIIKHVKKGAKVKGADVKAAVKAAKSAKSLKKSQTNGATASATKRTRDPHHLLPAIRNDQLGERDAARIETTSLGNETEKKELVLLKRASPEQAEALIKRAEAGEQVSAVAAVVALRHGPPPTSDPDSAAASADSLWDHLGIPADLDRSNKGDTKTNGAAAPVNVEVTPAATAAIAAKAEANTALSAREVQARAMQDVGPDSAAAVTCELGNEIHRLELKKIALTSDVEDLEREIEKLKATKLDAEKSNPPTDVKEPIALQDAIEALVYWGKHTVSFENLPEDVVFSRGDLDEVISKLRRMNELKSMVARRKSLASQQKAKAKAKAKAA